MAIADLRAIVRRTVGNSSDDALTAGSNDGPFTVAPGMVLCYNNNNNPKGDSSGGGSGGEMFRRCACEGRTGAAHSKKDAHGLHPVLEFVSEGWAEKVGMGSLFGGADRDGTEMVDLTACPPGGAVILGTPKRKWPWSWQQQSPDTLSSPLGASDHQVSLPQSAGLASVPSSASSAGESASTELDSASGSASGSGSVTPPTSVASGGSAGAGDADSAGGRGLGPSLVGSGMKRQRGWGSSEDDSEGGGLGRVESGKRRKMLGKIKETARDIRALVKGMPERDGDMDMVGDVEMEEG